MGAVKLVISDIDGTLVQHRLHSNNLAEADALIPQTAVDAVALLLAEGIPVVGVTGRTFEQSKDILTSLGITGPSVFSGGAIIRNLPDGEVLYEESLSEQAIYDVTAILSKYLADGRAIELNPSSLDATKHNSIWAKLRKSETQAVTEELSKVPNIYFVMNDGHGHNAEFGVSVLGKGTDKGSATKRLIAMLNLNASDVACIGDGANDIPMFKECGMRIAMGNGVDELKGLASHTVAPIDQDGFAEAVSTILKERQ